MVSKKECDVCDGNGAVPCIDCDSGGVIETEAQSDGWYWEDAKTRKLIRVSGTCVVIN